MSSRENAFDNFAIYEITVVAISGIFLCIAWKRLVRSYMQLNKGKYDVILLLEKRLPAAIFKTEWKALGEGVNPQIYKAFTKTENWIPIIFMVLYVALIVFGLLN